MKNMKPNLEDSHNKRVKKDENEKSLLSDDIRSIEVNFNNLRKKTCYAYDSLANKLNNAIKEYEKDYSEKGTLMIECDEIQREMDDLKQLIGSIAMCYNENDPEMKDVFEEIYSIEDAMVDFNPDSDD